MSTSTTDKDAPPTSGPPTSGVRAAGDARPKNEIFSHVVWGEGPKFPELQLVSDVMQTATALSSLRMSISDMFNDVGDFGPYDVTRAHITLAVITDPIRHEIATDESTESIRSWAKYIVEEESKTLATSDNDRLLLVERISSSLQNDDAELLEALANLLSYAEAGMHSRKVWTSIYRAAFNIHGCPS